jgi:hypothetical protein
MPVENSRGINLAGCISVILENAAGEIVFLVDHAVEIKVIVLGVHDRVIDHCFRAVDPAAHIAVFLEQLVKIDIDRSSLDLFL